MTDGKGKPKQKSAKAKKAKKAEDPARPKHEAAEPSDLWDHGVAADGNGLSPGTTEALQVAALHAIAAAKAFLDVAERVVQDPQLAGHALVAVRSVGKGVLGSLSAFGAAAADAEDDPPIEHIDVS